MIMVAVALRTPLQMAQAGIRELKSKQPLDGSFCYSYAMHSAIELQDIQFALNAAGIKDFTGTFGALGGGEVNDTYKLDCGKRHIILRVARYEGQRSLQNEARALRLLDSPHIPKLVFFDKGSAIKKRLWILETYIAGTTKPRLTVEQFRKLGDLLALVHRVPSTESSVNLKGQFLDSCKAFGTEQTFLHHPDLKLRALIQSAFEEFEHRQPHYNSIVPVLIHSDATPSNILVTGSSVGLIDWEFSKFNDPMADFSTVYYDDMEYNRGKWRIKINSEEKSALFDGYESGGGKIDDERIRFWQKFDKLGAAVFLYWRLHQSTNSATQPQIDQYRLDFDNLVASLSP